MAATFQDPGKCGCPAAACWPCVLPRGTHLTLSYNWTGTTGSTTLVAAGGGAYSWQSSPVTVGPGVTLYVVATCSSSCSTYYAVIQSGGPPTFEGIGGPTMGCSSLTGLTLTSYTCSPLNIVFTGSGGTLTITP